MNKEIENSQDREATNEMGLGFCSGFTGSSGEAKERARCSATRGL